MKMTALMIAASLLSVACAHNVDDAEPSPDDAVVRATNGEAAYLEHCAGCHETGMLGAPREGQPQEWADRSMLWQGVLMEHARTGYFEMPARGGKSNLPDALVNAAAEYMLEKTFPERQED